jgi:toxin ParE1/3/4
MARTKLRWTQRARNDLQQIKKHIAQAAPKSAQQFVQKLKAAAENLRFFPELGGVVQEQTDPEIREIIVGNYRVIYRYGQKTIEILMIYHDARLLHFDEMEND